MHSERARNGDLIIFMRLASFQFGRGFALRISSSCFLRIRASSYLGARFILNILASIGEMNFGERKITIFTCILSRAAPRRWREACACYSLCATHKRVLARESRSRAYALYGSRTPLTSISVLLSLENEEENGEDYRHRLGDDHCEPYSVKLEGER